MHTNLENYHKTVALGYKHRKMTITAGSIAIFSVMISILLTNLIAVGISLPIIVTLLIIRANIKKKFKESFYKELEETVSTSLKKSEYKDDFKINQTDSKKVSYELVFFGRIGNFTQLDLQDAIDALIRESYVSVKVCWTRGYEDSIVDIKEIFAD